MATLGSLMVKLGLDPSQFRNGLIKSRADLAAFKASLDDDNTSVGKLAKSLEKFGESAKQKIKDIAKLGVSVGAVAGTAISAAPALIKAGQWVVQLGQASLAAAPMLLGIGAAAFVVKAAFTGFGPNLLAAWNPFLAVLGQVRDKTAEIATAGLDPLIKKFTTLNMPAISTSFTSIASTSNKVVKSLLAWGNSAAGVMAIRNIVVSSSDAFAGLAPHITAVVIAFGNMLGRITAVSTAAGEHGLSGILDKIAAYFDRVNAATVLKGLDDLKVKLAQAVQLFKDIGHWISNAIEFFTTFKTEIAAVSDALAVLAIMFGGPVVAVVAAVGLIIRHWDDLKAAYASLKAYFTSNPVGSGIMDNLLTAAQTVVPALQKAWQAIWTAIGPVLTEIWNKITTQLIPAFSQFLAAISPIVAFCINILGPVVGSVFQNILAIISGAISIITGIIQVFTALLTGNWSLLWTGIKNILSGAWEAIVGIFNLWIFGKIAGILGGLAGFLSKFFVDAGSGILRAVADWIANLIGRVGGIPGAILRALGDLAGLLYDAGASVIRGLISGIESMIDRVGSAMSGIASTIRSYLPFSPAKAGPLSGSGAPNLAGAKISTMLTQGMLKQLPMVAGMAERLAAAASPMGVSTGSLGALPATPMPTGLTRATGGSSSPTLTIDADGKVGNLLLQVLQSSARGQGLTVVSAR